MQFPPADTRVALGTATMSLESGRDRGTDIATIRTAADAGIRLFDAARVYAPVGDPLYSEQLLAEALAGRDDVMIGTKGGHFRTAAGYPVDNRPERLRSDVQLSLGALGVDAIDLFYLHRADDTTVPLEESVEALAALRDEGALVRIGLSNVTAEQLDTARGITTIDAVQNPYSLAREWGAIGREASVGALRRCEHLGIPFFGYSPLLWDGDDDLMTAFPAVADIASERGISIQRMLLRALLAESESLWLVSGASRAATAVDAARATDEEWDDTAAEAFAADRSVQGRLGS